MWAFGYPCEKWTKERIQTYPKGKQGSVMVWAMIGNTLQESELVVMQRDEDSPRGGYSARSYCQTLEEGLLPLYEGQCFQQDNAPVHTAHFTQQWMADNNIWLHIGWPPYSPDMNPIEHVWWHLKKLVYQVRPDIDSITNKDRQKEALIEALPRAWKLIPRRIVEEVVNSMPRRIEALIAAQGWHTKY